jgi:uncharacterized membrane protein (DUF485 family)
MTDTMTDIERLESARRRMLTSYVIAFSLWQLPTILSEALRNTGSPNLLGALDLAAGLAGLYWLSQLIWMIRIHRQVASDPKLAAQMQDERNREHLANAFSAAFWVLLGYLVLIRLSAFITPLSSGLVAQAGILLGVVSPIIVFLLMERRDLVETEDG